MNPPPATIVQLSESSQSLNAALELRIATLERQQRELALNLEQANLAFRRLVGRVNDLVELTGELAECLHQERAAK